MPCDKSHLIVIPTNELGGAELILQYLAKELIKRDDKLTIVFLYHKSNEKGWVKFEDHIVSLSRRNIYFGFFKLLQFLIGRQFNYTICSQTYLNGLLGFYKCIGILKTQFLIIRESTSIFNRFKGWKKASFRIFYFLGYSAADLVICQTELMRHTLYENIAKARDWNCQVLRNPIDIEGIRSKIKSHKIDPITSKNILAVGRLITEKGFDVLIRAFFKFQKETNGHILEIIGAGPEEDNLKSLIKELGLHDKVFLRGYAFSPFDQMVGASICIVSSRHEGFPNTLHQMMLLNDRVGSTRCAGDVESLPGILTCEPDSEDELCHLLKRLASYYLTESDKLRKVAYLNSISSETYLNQIEEFLKRT